jgi:hypothetical protein
MILEIGLINLELEAPLPYPSYMRKIVITVITVLFVFPLPAEATKPITFQNQKAGQFCKNSQLGKFVRTADREILECKKDGSQARWTQVIELALNNQRKGQFCKVADIGSVVQLTDKSILRCKKDGSKARWKDA